MSVPELSVVMSVFNGARYLNASIGSILNQQDVNAEFIVINDGSVDSTAAILSEYAKHDSRLRVVNQENTGLTKALATGCEMARGEFVARHDLDDISLPGRLAKQLKYLKNHPEVALLSCGSKFIGPENEELYTVIRDEPPEEATAKIRASDIEDVQGISGHGSAMFRRADYERAGGYRQQFYYAQDLDLWRRITDFGLLDFFPEVLYAVRWDNGTISADKHTEQLILKGIIVELSSIRAEKREESVLLAEAEKIRPGSNSQNIKKPKGHGYYYVGRMLQHRNDPNAKKYLLKALSENPLHWRAALALIFGRYKKG